MNIALVYATEHGSTAEIAAFMQEYLDAQGYHTVLQDASKPLAPECSTCDAIILGAPIYKGLWHKDMLRFIARQHHIIQDSRIFVWIACIRILEADGLEHIKTHYIPTELEDLHVEQPLGIFAGKLNIDDLPEDERWAFHVRYDGRAKMEALKGDFRDWESIRYWLKGVVGKIDQYASTES